MTEGHKVRVLVVEDRPEDAELLMRELQQAGFDPDWRRVDTESEYLDQVRKEPDVIIADYSLPQFSAVRALRLLQDIGLDIPFVVVTGSVGEEPAVECMREGATDYLLKDRLTRLGPAVSRSIEQHELRLEKAELETQLRQAQKMEAIGQLAGGVAHDFNNLLTVIGGYADLIKREESTSNGVRECAAEIQKAQERGAGLTRQLLAFARKQVVQPRILDVNSVVQGLEKFLRRLIGEHIELIFDLPADLGHITADPGQLEQVVMNLVVNARDALPDGGTLHVETANLESDRPIRDGAATVPAGRHVVLRVADSGRGMDEATRTRMFEPFFTTKPRGKGTGLGLSTVYGIVEQIGGEIVVDSELGAGTTVKIYFPCREVAETEPSLERQEESAYRGSETILLAEDDQAIRRLVRTILERLGYTILEARDGLDALRVAKGHTAQIDLLLTDLVMPGISGSELAQRLRQSHPEVGILFMSGYTDDTIDRPGMRKLSDHLLIKPFTPVGLKTGVREALDVRARDTTGAKRTS